MTQPTLEKDINIDGVLTINSFIGIGGTGRLEEQIQQTGTTLIGADGDFTSDMVGGVVKFDNGMTAFITGFINPFNLTTSEPANVSLQNAIISFGGSLISSEGISTDAAVVQQLSVTTISAVNVNATNNVSAGAAVIAGTTVSAGTDIIAAGAISGATLDSTGNATIGGDVIATGNVGGGTISSIGNATIGANLSAVNVNVGDTVSADSAAIGDIITTTVNATTVNSTTINATTATITNATISTGFTAPTVAGPKGSVLASQGSGVLGSLAPGTDGSSIFYDSTTATGLTNNLPIIEVSTEPNIVWTGAIMTLNARRVDTMAEAFINSDNNFTLVVGDFAPFRMTFILDQSPQFAAFVPDGPSIACVRATINDSAEVAFMGIRAGPVANTFEISLGSVTSTDLPWDYLWPVGTTIRIDLVHAGYYAIGL